MYQLLISHKELEARVIELSKEIAEYYRKDNVKVLHVVCILNGSVHFFSDLVLNLPMKARYHFFKGSSYDGKKSTQRMRIDLDFRDEIRDQHVLIVEDIIELSQKVVDEGLK